MMKLSDIRVFIIIAFAVSLIGCNYATHRTISKDNTDQEDPEPQYEISLEDDYQDFTSYIFMGNRVENFSTFFNVYYTADDEFEQALEEYRTNTLAAYNRKLDSLNINTSLSSGAKEKLNSVIKGASKVIQYRKNSRFIDDAVLLIGKSYYYLNDYLQAERKFNEFLSKLSSSKLTDEAKLYMGKTKMKLGNTNEGETILKNLLKNSPDDFIKSEAAQELAINAVSQKDYESAINYFGESVKFATDSDTKAEKQYILAKIYTIYKPTQAAGQYKKALDLTSDFDLSFFSTLNYAKSLMVIKDFRQAGNILEDLDSKYREYPDYKQLVELEIANNYNQSGQSEKALKKYYEVIVQYPSTITAAEAYYYLAKFYEDQKDDYFNALINYNLVNKENSLSDYAFESTRKANTFDRYFTLKAVIDGNEKPEIPQENLGVENFRRIYQEETGTGTNKDGGNQPGLEEGEGKGLKGRGYPPLDTLKEEETSKDPLLEMENKPVDSIITTQVPLDTIETEEDKRFDAYFELAELFLYKLNRPDSSEYYLNKILSLYSEPEKEAKTLYALGNVYKNSGKPTEANEIFARVIDQYPESIFANESRKVLGKKTLDLDKDEAEGLYKEASNDIYSGRYEEALTKLNELTQKYPTSSYIPNALYSIGWIYENVKNDKDNTIAYYSRLKDGYPNSEFIEKVTVKLNALQPELNKNEDTEKPVIEEEIKTEENTEIKTPDESQLDGEIPPEVLEEIQKQNQNIENEGDKNEEEGDGRRE